MPVAIFSDGMLGSPSWNHGGGLPRRRRPSTAMFAPGWDRHVEEVEGHTPAYGAALLCDMPGAPPCDKGSVTAGLSGWGQTRPLAGINPFSCDTHINMKQQLELLLGEARRMSVNSLAIQQAEAYASRFRGLSAIFSTPLLSSTCTEETNNATAHYNAVNAAIQQAGGIPGVTPTVPIDGPSDVAGTIKTVAIAGAVIVGGILLIPIVWKLFR